MEEAFASFLLFIVCTFLLTGLIKLLLLARRNTTKLTTTTTYGPKSYPIIGAARSFSANAHRLPQYFAQLIRNSPTHTIIIDRPFFASKFIVTANPSNVEHILKTKFHAYPKGLAFHSALYDLLGNGIFNADGEIWKIQRKIASHEFNTKSLRKFIDTVVKSEISDRLLPLFAASAAGGTSSVFDLQDVLQRFGFDNICNIAFGYDPGCLDLSLPPSQFTAAFNLAVLISSDDLKSPFPFVWKIRRALNVGTAKALREAVRVVDDQARSIIRERRQNPTSSPENSDLLSRFMSSNDVDEDFLRDIVISFILAGMDTTSAALTWFFWLVSNHEHVEREILKEVSVIGGEVFGFDEVKEMTYLHAAICESMRLYPPVPADSKDAAEDDVLPDGTVVPKGARVMYHPYAMGRMESLWGKDCEEFRPERWLQEEEDDNEPKWKFVSEDPYKYPVFQAGPRICLGKEMAFIQMKSLAASVLRRFKVSPAVPNFQPMFVATLTAKMKGGFPVKIEARKP